MKTVAGYWSEKRAFLGLEGLGFCAGMWCENRFSMGCPFDFRFSLPNVLPKIGPMTVESSLRCWPQCRQFSKQGLHQNLP